MIVGKKHNVLAALDEARGGCSSKDDIPIASIKYDRREPIIVMLESDFGKLLSGDY